MAAGDILTKYGTPVDYAMTIDGGVTNNDGHIGPLVDNSSDGYELYHVFVKVKATTSAPTAGKKLFFYVLRQDQVSSPNLVTEGYTIGDADTATKPKITMPVKTLQVPSSPSSGEVLQGHFIVHDPGIAWGLLLWNEIGVALSGTAADHDIRIVGQYRNQAQS